MISWLTVLLLLLLLLLVVVMMMMMTYMSQPMYYHKSKSLNVSALASLQKNAKFNDIEVDTNVSTIHVPTHVYDECTCRKTIVC